MCALLHRGRLRHFCLLLFLLSGPLAWSQKTVNISRAEADEIFLQKNLYLLAANLNIDQQKALEIQAKTYPNPQFSASLNAVDPENNKVFHTGPDGEKGFSLDQLIVLGGKRKNEIELARLNTKQAEIQLGELLRQLRRQLHESLYEVYFDQITVSQYTRQLSVLDSIIVNYGEQAKKGNISLKEVVRLKSVFLSLNNEKTDLLNRIQEEEKNLRILLHTESFINPQLEDQLPPNKDNLPGIDSLLSLAMTNRSDRQISVLQTDIARKQLSFQKSLAVPDLNLGLDYDQRGGAFQNQVNLNLGIPLPVWNRNQGNIRAAKVGIKSAGLALEANDLQISSEVIQAYHNMLRSIQEFQKSQQLYDAGFDTVSTGITENFRKRNISMLEFVDFFESYNVSLSQLNQVRKNVFVAAEELNYVLGFPMYK